MIVFRVMVLLVVIVMLMVSIGIDIKKRMKYVNFELGFEKIVVNYGMDILNFVGDYICYFYGLGFIFVVYGVNENIIVGSLE